MRIINLGSGSGGNATIICTLSTNILIDAGLTYKQLQLRSSGLIDEISDVLITHEHIDHICGLGVLSKKHELHLYTHEKTWNCISQRVDSKTHCSFIDAGINFTIGDISITPITLFHDAVAPLGFVFEAHGEKVVYITDTGYVHRNTLATISNANVYFLESNHDIAMLMNSDRRHELKVRIYGDKGHLSNVDASALLCYALGPATKKIIFGHISEECNENSLIEMCALKTFETFGYCFEHYQVFYAQQGSVLTVEVE